MSNDMLHTAQTGIFPIDNPHGRVVELACIAH